MIFFSNYNTTHGHSATSVSQNEGTQQRRCLPLTRGWKQIQLKDQNIKQIINVQFICTEAVVTEINTAGKIWGFHGGDYEECRILVCDTV
jgi:hypothetical protein